MNFNPSEEEINFVNDALRQFNDEKVGPDNHVLLNIVEYDENKNFVNSGSCFYRASLRKKLEQINKNFKQFLRFCNIIGIWPVTTKNY